VIHYHGTPITPKYALESMGGENFCVSFAHPYNLKECLRIGQSLMLDNGAFSCKTRGVKFDIEGFYAWVDPILVHPHWAVVPDVIDGDVEMQKSMVKTWPFPKSFGIPVWHLGLPISYLIELCEDWGKVCIGSSGEYWNVGSPKWASRMDETFNALSRTFGSRLPWTHGLRMLGQGLSRWPLSSADSTNVALHHAEKNHCAGCMAKAINKQNPSGRWVLLPEQGDFFK
jgi:hypothetical protein